MSYITVDEAAMLLGVSRSTIRRLFDTKQLSGVRTPGGHRRVSREGVEELLSRRKKAGEITYVLDAATDEPEGVITYPPQE